MTSIPPNEPPKPFVLSYSAPPTRRPMPVLLWQFSVTAGCATCAVVTLTSIVFSAIEGRAKVGQSCGVGTFIGVIMAVNGLIVASAAHAIRRYAVGSVARSRTGSAHAQAGLCYGVISIAWLIVSERLHLGRFYDERDMIVVLFPVVVFAAAAGCILITRDHSQ